MDGVLIARIYSRRNFLGKHQMPRLMPEPELDEIEKVVRAQPGITSAEVEDALAGSVPRRTLQYRLKHLVDEGRLVRDGGGRWARYRTPEAAAPPVPHQTPTAAAAA